MQKTKSEQNIEDIEFIISEIIRFNSMKFEELKAHLNIHKNDAFCKVSHPRGDGSLLIIGEAAQLRFYDLAERHLSTRPDLKHKFDIDLFVKAIKKEFERKFLKQSESEVNKRNLDKLLAEAVKKARQSHKAITHYIPCIIVSSREPEIFKIGPVSFVLMEKFLRDHKAAFDEERNRLREEHIRRCEEAIAGGSTVEDIATPEISEEFANRLVGDTIDYFEKFKWMAIVRIPECDVTLSRERAERAIEASLDILKLFFGRLHGKALRLRTFYRLTP